MTSEWTGLNDKYFQIYVVTFSTASLVVACLGKAVTTTRSEYGRTSAN
jgi:hypothetical protein